MTRRRADPSAAAARDALALAMTADHLRDLPRGYGGGYRTPDLSAECYVIIGGDRCRRGAGHSGDHEPRALPTCSDCTATGWTREDWPGKPDGWTCDRVMAWHPAPATVARALTRRSTR